jgi:hypothetical protein
MPGKLLKNASLTAKRAYSLHRWNLEMKFIEGEKLGPAIVLAEYRGQ